MCSSCYMRDKHREIKQLAVEYKGNSCLVCGYNRCIAALVFHHMKDKKFSISGSIRSWNKTKEELDKCVLLCSNCHDELHNGLLENSYLINLEQERIVKLQ